MPVRIQYGGRFFDTTGLVDSGADYSLFHKGSAQVLGLTIDPAAAQRGEGAGGDVLDCWWYFDVFLTVGGKRFPGRVAFAARPDKTALLGRSDVFNAFNGGFDQRNQQFFLHSLT